MYQGMKRRYGYAAQQQRARDEARAQQALAQPPPIAEPALSEPIAEPAAEPVAEPVAAPAASRRATPAGPYVVESSASLDQLQAQVNLIEAGYHFGNGVSVGVQGPNATFGAKQTEDHTAVGAGASVLGAGVTYQGDDHYARFGLSGGLAAGLRTYHGDKEGFGFDFGPVSADAWSRRAPGEPVGKPPADSGKTPYDGGW